MSQNLKAQQDLLKIKKPYILSEDDGPYLFYDQLEKIKSCVGLFSGEDSSAIDGAALESAQVIGVSGERGSGKTSFLSTMKNILAKDSKLEILDIIDPGTISEKLSLVEILVALIYNKWQEKTNESEEKQCTSPLLEELKKTIEVMANLKGGTNNFYVDVPNISILEKISRHVDFKTQINNLVNEYLQFSNTEERKNERLVLLIDDLDMVANKQIISILEDIRKHFPPDIIVIIAYRQAQLIDSVMQVKLSENKDLPNSQGEAKQQAVRYLEKLIPTENRVALFQQNELYKKTMAEILLPCLEVKDHFNVKNDCKQTFEEFAAEFIYNLTSIQIQPVSHKEKTRNYLPSNLRGIVQMISMFIEMDISINDEESNPNNFTTYNNTAIKNNLAIFKAYYYTRIKEFSDPEHLEIINNWESERLNRKNFNLYHQIRNILKSDKEIANSSKNNIDSLNVLFKTNSPTLETYNISIANVYTILQIYEDTLLNEDAYSFVYVMKLLYSILLLEQILLSENNDYSQYLEIINGKIIPDYFTYNYRRSTDQMYIRVSKKNLSNDQKALLNKLLYTNWGKESELRQGKTGELSRNSILSLYYRNMTVDQAKGV